MQEKRLSLIHIYVKEHGLTLCADGFRRLIIRKENDMATPYKECPRCGAHRDSGEKCECREEEIEAKNSQLSLIHI